jgi:selenocysteine lyase/cysteine desulfurase
MPLHEKFGVKASIRASLALYNDSADIEQLAAGLQKAKKLLS